ncbi:hypothetical protein JCM18899A_15360 [Nocardioides sp. AN3]
MRHVTRGVVSVATAAVVICGLALAGCSSGSEQKPAGRAPTRSASPSAAPDPTKAPARVATVTGRLGSARRDELAAAVTTVIDGWLDRAYLGDFPRSDYAAAFSGFTAGAAAKARRDLALMSNAAIADRIQRAEATTRSISLDVLSISQRPVGVTARVDLGFQTTGTVTGPQEVTGTLDLTPVGNTWKIFGYEITRTPA